MDLFYNAQRKNSVEEFGGVLEGLKEGLGFKIIRAGLERWLRG